MAATSTKGPYEGGVGGKIRRKPAKRALTPYERPSVFQAAKDALNSKLVEPASRILARSVRNMFASLFRKRLTAPPLVPEATREPRDGVEQANTVMQSPGSGARGRVSNEHDNRTNVFGNTGVNEIEEVLKQKTFTKAEIDHLTELLRSRTETVPAENAKKKPEPKTSHMEATQDFHGHANFLVQRNKMENQRSHRGISASAANSSVLETDVSSAAELAKAYMGSTPLKVSPSDLRSQAFRKDIALLTNAPYTPKSSGISLAPSSAAGVSENVYSIPRPRGRSAIYNMARTPNSRVHDSATRKINGYIASSSQWPVENNTHSSGNQALKRRSSILDSDIGSVGPIRRIRQKTNMMSPKHPSLPTHRSHFFLTGNADGSDIAQGSTSVRQKQMFLNGGEGTSNVRFAETYDARNQNSPSVPPRSSEMAEKILQQLDKLGPSPKEKVSELKLAVSREKSPTKLTPNMLHGKALRSLENVDSSKLLEDGTSNGLDVSQSHKARDSTSHEQKKVDNEGYTLISDLDNKLAPKENGLHTKGLEKNVSTNTTSESAIVSFAEGPIQKKRVFRMSAYEDFVDFDDGSDNAGVGLSAEHEKQDQTKLSTQPIVVETRNSQNHSVPSAEIKSPRSSLPKEVADAKVNIVSTVAEKNAGFSFPVTPASGTITHISSPTPQGPLFSSGASLPKEMTSVPIPSFGSKNVDKAAPFKFSSKSLGANESLDSTFGLQSEPKSTQSSTTAAAASLIDTPKISTSDGSDKPQKIGDLFGRAGNSILTDSSKLFGRAEDSVPSGLSTSATTNLFSPGTSANSPKADNGFFSSPSGLPVSAAQVSDGSSNVIFSVATSTAVSATSTSPTISTTSSNPSVAGSTPSFSAPSMFKFGSNAVSVPSNTSSILSSTSGIESTKSELKDKTTSSFGSFTNPPFSAPSSEFTSMGSSIFGLSASTTSSTPNVSLSSTNQSMASNPFGTAAGSLFGAGGISAETTTSANQSSNPFGTNVGSVFGAQGTSAETKSSSNQSSNPFGTTVGSIFGAQGASAETKTGAAPFFGLSSSSSTVGQSTSASLGSGSSLFGSATPSTNLFGSSSGFGLSSSASTGAKPFTSSSGTTVFGSSMPSSTSPIFGSGFGSTTSTTGFPFGASSTAAAPASSSPMVFGSSLGSSSAPIFSFTPASVTTSASQQVFGSSSPMGQFGSTPLNNDQSNMEDSMAEDTVQASSAFGQPANSPPPSSFVFGSGAPSGGSPFQFGNQQNLGVPQTPSPFQAGGSLDVSAGGSFSLGTGGGDKSGRKFIRARRDKSRKR